MYVVRRYTCIGKGETNRCEPGFTFVEKWSLVQVEFVFSNIEIICDLDLRLSPVGINGTRLLPIFPCIGTGQGLANAVLNKVYNVVKCLLCYIILYRI